LGSSIDLAPLSDSEKSKKTVIWAKDAPMEGSKPPSPNNSTASTSSNRTCASPTPKPEDPVSQILTPEEYVRRQNIARALYSSEELLQDVILFMKDEMKKTTQKNKIGSDCEEI
jgi:hypothetical protein